MLKALRRATILGSSMALTAGLVLSSASAFAADGGANMDKLKGTSYYVSSSAGNDQNSGTSQDKPFKSLAKINEIKLGPGDKVLLKRGDTWNGQAIHVKTGSSGSKDAPIQIKPYGDGSARPVINTNGAGRWNQDYHARIESHRNKAEISSAVLLKDVNYLEISGLEVTNDREMNPAADPKAYNDGLALERTGVAGIAENGPMRHIVVADMYIHDIDGNIYDKHLANGGIYFMAHYPESGKPATEADKIARFDDLQILNNRVETVSRWGIAAGYTAYQNIIDRPQNGPISDEIIAKYGSSKVVIRGNYIKDAGGDSITTMYCDRPLIEYNVSDGAARHMNTTDYLHPHNVNGPAGSGWGRVAAGIWPWRCKNAIFQYNEAFNTRHAFTGNGDGQPWDADFGDGTVYQYNYSYANTGATIMFCNNGSLHNTFRYNIAHSDVRGALDIPDQKDAHVYNNTFIMGEGSSIITRGHAPTRIENNIFYKPDGVNKVQENWKPGNQVYDHNLYYNFATTPQDANKQVVAKGTALLKNPAAVEMASNHQARIHDGSTATTVFDGFKPVAGSAAIGNGKTITDANGYTVEHDFFGTAISGLPTIGAAEIPVPAPNPAASPYQIDNKAKTITVAIAAAGSNKAPLVKNFLAQLGLPAGVKAKVMSGNTQLGMDDPITEGAKVVIGEGAQASEYTVKVVSDFDWVRDYRETPAGNNKWMGVQGPYWFAQIKQGNTWANMTTYDNDGWHNWAYNQYYGPGLDHNQGALKAPDQRGDIHGLLSSETPDTAMAFKAPASGKVTFKIKDDEPYLRQNNHDPNATVTVSLMLNDKVLKSVDLKNSRQKGDFVFNEQIALKAGDYLRVVSHNEGSLKANSVHISPVIKYVETDYNPAGQPVYDPDSPAAEKPQLSGKDFTLEYSDAVPEAKSKVVKPQDAVEYSWGYPHPNSLQLGAQKVQLVADSGDGKRETTMVTMTVVKKKLTAPEVTFDDKDRSYTVPDVPTCLEYSVKVDNQEAKVAKAGKVTVADSDKDVTVQVSVAATCEGYEAGVAAPFTHVFKANQQPPVVNPQEPGDNPQQPGDKPGTDKPGKPGVDKPKPGTGEAKPGKDNAGKPAASGQKTPGRSNQQTASTGSQAGMIALLGLGFVAAGLAVALRRRRTN